jgi:excisionase family DNA binding protein
MDEWMTVEEAAGYLRISKSDIRKYIRRGKLRCYVQGNDTQLMTSDLDAFIIPHEPF